MILSDASFRQVLDLPAKIQKKIPAVNRNFPAVAAS
jgi:hypothetical protein